MASLTDKLDGYIARSRNQVTAFGKFLDPLADKILVLAAMLMLVEMGKLPAWIPIIVLAREFLVSGYRLVAVEKGGEVIAASKCGKLKTVTQMIAIILAFLDLHAFGVCFTGTLQGAEAFGHHCQGPQDRPERSLPLRQRKEVQILLRKSEIIRKHSF